MYDNYDKLLEAYIRQAQINLATLDLAMERKKTSQSDIRRFLDIAVESMGVVFQMTCPLNADKHREFGPEYRDLYDRFVRILRLNNSVLDGRGSNILVANSTIIAYKLNHNVVHPSC